MKLTTREDTGDIKNHELNQDEWILITKQEYELVEATYSEIDEIRRDLKINQILEK
jgi:hypothetical protein